MSLNLSSTPKHPWRNGQRNHNIEDGCKRLQESQAPGQTFSPSEIARACGVTVRAITFIERRALGNFARRLHAASPKFFEELLGGRPMSELFNGLGRNPYRTGKPARREKKVKRMTEIQLEHNAGGMTLHQVNCALRERYAGEKWGSKEAASKAKHYFGHSNLGGVGRANERTAENGTSVLDRQMHEAAELVQKSGGRVRVAA